MTTIKFLLHNLVRYKLFVALLLAHLPQLYQPTTLVSAHQPFFEKPDTTSANVFEINDPTISTAIYASLDSIDDIDYFTFYGTKDSNILIGITIPDIEKNKGFAPYIALIGPNLPITGKTPESLLLEIETSKNGAVVLPPLTKPTWFFEPYSRTSYWRQQRKSIALPSSSTYTVAVWSDSTSNQYGKYVLVIGDREIRGGDPDFKVKLVNYWKPSTSASPIAEMPLWRRVLYWMSQLISN